MQEQSYEQTRERMGACSQGDASVSTQPNPTRQTHHISEMYDVSFHTVSRSVASSAWSAAPSPAPNAATTSRVRLNASGGTITDAESR